MSKNESEQKPSFVDRYLSVVDAMAELQLKQMSEKFSESLTQIITDKEAEISKNLTAAFGERQPVALNKADLAKLGRRIALENSESGRKTPAPIEKAGPEGNTPADPIDKLLKAYEVKV